MEDLKTRISLAAQELFLRDGIEGVSMRKVAEKVGVSAPAIYRYFKDKDELLNEIIVAGLDILQQYLEKALVAPTAEARLRRLIDGYLQFATEQPRYFEFAFLVPSRNIDRFAVEIQRSNMGTFRMAIEQVSKCMDEGVLRRSDPIETAILIWSTVHGIVTLYRIQRFGADESQFRKMYARTVERLLEALRPLEPTSAASPATRSAS